MPDRVLGPGRDADERQPRDEAEEKTHCHAAIFSYATEDRQADSEGATFVPTQLLFPSSPFVPNLAYR